MNNVNQYFQLFQYFIYLIHIIHYCSITLKLLFNTNTLSILPHHYLMKEKKLFSWSDKKLKTKGPDFPVKDMCLKIEETFGKAPSHVANDYTKYYREELLACWELKFHESNIQRPLKCNSLFFLLNPKTMLKEIRLTLFFYSTYILTSQTRFSRLNSLKVFLCNSVTCSVTNCEISENRVKGTTPQMCFHFWKQDDQQGK
ncbi:hypothetical protein Avbf_00894 [Armadillidium vulgare]|nr:hypothetical protein Avbf_00894 [Armadillidium vulgare]